MQQPAVCIGTTSVSGRVLYLYRQRGDEANRCQHYFGLSEYRRGPCDAPMFCEHPSIASALFERFGTARVSVRFLCSAD